MKKCYKCSEIKNKTEFVKCSKNSDGLYSYCKKCTYETKRPMRWKELGMDFSLEDYTNLSELQDNKCAICKEDASTNKRRLAVDHCHKTGNVRGLLCGKCNTALGKFKDDIEILQNAINYLKTPPYSLMGKG